MSKQTAMALSNKFIYQTRDGQIWPAGNGLSIPSTEEQRYFVFWSKFAELSNNWNNYWSYVFLKYW